MTDYYSAQRHYLLHVPILAFNVCVVATMAWVVGAGANDIDAYILGAFVASILTGIVTLWVVIGIILTAISPKLLPTLARIILDSVISIPCYIASALLLGIATDWRLLTQAAEPERDCYSTMNVDQCQRQWRLVLGLQILAIILSIFSLGLTTVNLVYAIRLRRQELIKINALEGEKLSHEPVYPEKQNYIVHGTILGLNIFVLITMAWATSGAAQDKLYTDGTGFVGPMVALICTGLVTVWVLTVLVLAKYGEKIPSLARILVDSLLSIPAYLSSIILMGILMDWQWLWLFNDVSGSCTMAVSNEECHNIWRAVLVLQFIAMILNTIALALTLFDFVFSVKLHRKLVRSKKTARLPTSAGINLKRESFKSTKN